MRRRRSSVAGISRSRGESQWRNTRELLGRARTVVTGPVSRTTRPHSPLRHSFFRFYELRLASVTVRRCVCSDKSCGRETADAEWRSYCMVFTSETPQLRAALSGSIMVGGSLVQELMLRACRETCEHVLAHVSHSYTSRTHEWAGCPWRRQARRPPDRGDRVHVLLDAITEAVASISFREAPRWVSSGVALLDLSSSYACRNSKLFHLFRSRLGGRQRM